MKSDIKNIAAFLAVAIWADGVYAVEEELVLADIAEALEVEVAGFKENIEVALGELEGKDEEAVQAENASAIEENETKVLMQCAIEIVLADNFITQEEVQVLFDLADATGAVEHTDVALMLVDLIKYNPDIEIKF